VSTSAIDCLERLVSEMIYYVSHSLAYMFMCSLTSQTSVETPPPGRSHAATSGLGYAQVASSHHSQPSTSFTLFHFYKCSSFHLAMPIPVKCK